jgi:hypothetical protein
MATLVFSLLLILEPGGASSRPAPSPVPTIDWPDFFASVSIQGVVFSDRVKALEGHRVRLRGYSVTQPSLPGAVFLTRIPFVESDPHGPGSELDVPFDAVGVVWRSTLTLPPVPKHPTVEGTLRLGNRTLGDSIVVLTLEDAVPVYPKSSAKEDPKPR